MVARSSRGPAGPALTVEDASRPLWIARRRAIAVAGLVAASLGTTASALLLTGGRARSPRTMLQALPTPPPYATMTAIDLSGDTSAVAVLRELAGRALRAGGDAEVTLALGASWFERAGPTASRPVALTPMPSFAGDVLAPDLVHGDLLLHVAGTSGAAVLRARASLLAGVRGIRTRWERSGFRAENTVRDGRGLTRNLFGFVEGQGNPPLADLSTAADVALVRPGQGEPGWAEGGSYLVVRVIEFAREFWDHEPVAQQERVIGRRRDGDWLDGTPAARRPGFTADPQGRITPLDSHVRRADPRTPGVSAPRMVRRGYSYRDAPDPAGAARDGLLFVALQADLERGFAGVQRRLAGQALDHYTLTIGGGYFFVPDLSRGSPF